MLWLLTLISTDIFHLLGKFLERNDLFAQHFLFSALLFLICKEEKERREVGEDKRWYERYRRSGLWLLLRGRGLVGKNLYCSWRGMSQESAIFSIFNFQLLTIYDYRFGLLKEVSRLFWLVNSSSESSDQLKTSSTLIEDEWWNSTKFSREWILYSMYLVGHLFLAHRLPRK